MPHPSSHKKNIRKQKKHSCRITYDIYTIFSLLFKNNVLVNTLYFHNCTAVIQEDCLLRNKTDSIFET